MRTWLSSTLCFALLGLVGACSGGAPAAPPAPPAPAPKAAAPSPGPAAAPAGALTGKVAETMDSGGYTYLKLQTPGGEIWAAVPVTPVAVGATVSVQNPMTMNGFASKTLGRVFDKIVFGTLAGAGAGAGAGAAPPAAGAAPPAAGAAGVPPMAAPHGGVAAPTEEIHVTKAAGPNAHTVAEIFAGKKALADKKVSVHGKVVKYSGGILGRNWLHLRDGTGTAASADHDLTVTTAGTAAVGDVVLVEGTVHLDQDFGAGYAYPVLLGEATVTKAP